MASIARKNLFEDIPRFLIAQAGIIFAVSLVSIQTGILQGFTRSTALLIDQSKADLWVGSKYMVHFELTLPIPYQRVAQAKKNPAVETAEALMVRATFWRDPVDNISLVRIIGFDPAGKLFAPQPIKRGDLSFLKQPYSLMVDESTMKSLNVQWLGDEAVVGSRTGHLVGWTQGTQSIVSSAFMYTSLENANAFINSDPFGFSFDDSNNSLSAEDLQQLTSGNITDPTVWQKLANLPPEKLKQLTNSEQIRNSELGKQLIGLTPEELQKLAASKAKGSTPAKKSPVAPKKLIPEDQIAYVLVKAKPGQDLDLLKRQLEAAMPDTRAWTKAEMAQKTRSYWIQRTGIGFILGLGATVGVIVGTVIVGQILYASASDHMKEFGTLKAMGASDWVIYGIIIEQALWMAVLGYTPGMLLCWGLGQWTLASQGITILITPVSAAGVFAVTAIMCVGSALFAIQKVTRVDPAIVFKA